MPWPSPQDYSEAVQNPKTAFYDPDLQRGSPELNRLGLPRPRSGSFASVYKILCGSKNWAVRCFLHPVSDQQERYAEISKHLAKINLPYLVQFSFLTHGIRVAGQTYPILKMEWVEGESLIPYVETNLHNRNALLDVARRWSEMTKALRQSSIAHGDLQHGNVLVVSGDLRLVDYDGMFVPSLAGKRSSELGQRNYQHPQRTELNYSPDLDNFSSWVVYVSLVALSVQPQLWSQFQGGDDCLLFRREDFEDPDSSAILQALENSPIDNLRSLAACFRPLLDLSPQDVPSLHATEAIPIYTTPSRASGGTWIEDYVKPGPKTPPGPIEQARTEPEPNPSWIQDFVAPLVTSTDQRQFENSVKEERLALTLSMTLLAFMLICWYSGLFTLSILVIAILSVSITILAFSLYRFSLDPAFSQRGGVKKDLQAIRNKIEMVRSIIESRQADRKSIQERYTFDQTKTSETLVATRSEERRETEGTQKPFASEKNSIASRRRELNHREAAELQNIAANIGSQITALTKRISELNQAESNEIAAALGQRQNQHVMAYLRKYHLDDAGIQGIGPGFRSRLRLAGILSAADIDHRIYSVKGIGPSRSSALSAWHQALKTRAQQNMPRTLPVAEADAITAKYAGQCNLLRSQKAACEHQLRESEAPIRTKFARLREPLDKQEAAALASMKSKLEIIQKKYNDRYRSMEVVRSKLDEDLKQSTVEIDAKINKERQNLWALHWEQERIRRRLRAFARITFSAYLKRVIGFA